MFHSSWMQMDYDYSSQWKNSHDSFGQEPSATATIGDSSRTLLMMLSLLEARYHCLMLMLTCTMRFPATSWYTPNIPEASRMATAFPLDVRDLNIEFNPRSYRYQPSLVVALVQHHWQSKRAWHRLTFTMFIDRMCWKSWAEIWSWDVMSRNPTFLTKGTIGYKNDEIWWNKPNWVSTDIFHPLHWPCKQVTPLPLNGPPGIPQPQPDTGSDLSSFTWKRHGNAKEKLDRASGFLLSKQKQALFQKGKDRGTMTFKGIHHLWTSMDKPIWDMGQ